MLMAGDKAANSSDIVVVGWEREEQVLIAAKFDTIYPAPGFPMLSWVDNL